MQRGFSGRLAYVRWLRGRGRARLETDAEFGAALGLSAAWVVKWKSEEEAPNDRDTAKKIEAMRAVPGLTAGWLFDAIGEPPEPEQWNQWLSALTIPHYPGGVVKKPKGGRRSG